MAIRFPRKASRRWTCRSQSPQASANRSGGSRSVRCRAFCPAEGWR